MLTCFKKLTFGILIPLIFFLFSPTKTHASNQVILGLHVGNINSKDRIYADVIANILKNMNVRSVRVVYQKPTTKSLTAYAIKKLNSYGIDVMVTIMPYISDYSDPSVSYSDYPLGSSAFGSSTFSST